MTMAIARGKPQDAPQHAAGLSRATAAPFDLHG
jgi:hypothetical protein